MTSDEIATRRYVLTLTETEEDVLRDAFGPGDLRAPADCDLDWVEEARNAVNALRLKIGIAFSASRGLESSGPYSFPRLVSIIDALSGRSEPFRTAYHFGSLTWTITSGAHSVTAEEIGAALCALDERVNGPPTADFLKRTHLEGGAA